MFFANRLKYISVVGTTLIFSVVAFLGGVYVGNQHGFASAMLLANGIGILDDRRALQLLDQGKVDDAISYLNSAIDVEIIGLDQFRQNSYLVTQSDRDLLDRTLHTLNIIAKYRADHPSSDHIHLPETEKKVQSILDSN